MAIVQDVRMQLLGNDTDEVTLSDGYINLMIKDAKDFIGISDSNLSLRYYTCYLIASNWDSVGAVAKREGVDYRAPDPSKYLALYEDSLKGQIEDVNDKTPYGGKESTNKDYYVDDDGIMQEGSDL